MKNLKVATFITVFFIAMSATSLLAQGQTRTSGARAAYGYPTEYKKSKKKKKKQRKAPKNKAKAKEPLYRKKSPWVN